MESFKTLFLKTKDNLHHILDSLSKSNLKPGSIEQKVGDFYASGMDSAYINKLSYEPLKSFLQEIAAIKNKNDILQLAIDQVRPANNFLFSANITPDEKNSLTNIAIFGQTGLGMPDRDYYFKKDSSTLSIVEAYKCISKHCSC